MNDCSICGKPIDDQKLFVSDGDGGHAHGHCHERAHPPRYVKTIWEVVEASNARVAADVISEMAPQELAAAIVAEVNRRTHAQWALRCEAQQNDKG